MANLCDSTATVIFNWILSVLLLIFFMIVLYSHRKYLQNLSSVETKKKAIWLHRMVILFYSFTIIYLLTSIPSLIFTPCAETSSILSPSISIYMIIIIEISNISYFGHWLFMVCILFSRLYYIFKDTAYSLSKLNIITFKSIIFMIIISLPIALYFKTTTEQLGTWLLFVISIWLLSLFIVFLFIYKLRQFHTLSRRYSHTNDKLTCIHSTLLLTNNIIYLYMIYLVGKRNSRYYQQLQNVLF